MKRTPILFYPRLQLRKELPPEDLEVARRILLQCISGMDAKHQKRWNRFWGRVFNAEPGEAFAFVPDVDRSLVFHKRWMAIERRIFENQEAFRNLDRFRDWLKTGAGWGEYRLVGERMRFVPASVNFDSASDDEMREFAAAAEEFLHTPRASRKLWPHLTPKRRAEMVEALITNPNEEHH